jgi:hypothetical protein
MSDRGTVKKNQVRQPIRLFTGLVGLPPEETPAIPAPVPIPYQSATDLLEKLEADKKSKRAVAARARRKLQADQIKRIKEVLQVPIAEVKAAAAEKLRAEKFPAMSAGAYMPEAPTSRGKLVSGGYDSAKVDLITGFEVAEEATLGGNVNASNATTTGRRHGKPEGNSPDEDFNRDEAEFNFRSGEAANGWSEPAASRSFQVRLNTDGQYEIQRALDSLCCEFFADGVCRLCYVSCQDIVDAIK